MKFDQKILDAFHHEIYRQQHDDPWFDMTWRGVPLIKNPCDLFVFAELAYRLQPDLIIETGTWKGGSALFWANICDLNGKGDVCTVDVADDYDSRPKHPRIHYFKGNSTDQNVFGSIREQGIYDANEVVLVDLDSDHAKDHVLKEMMLYGPLVTPGSYMIVEDTNVNGHPVAPEHGPGPWEAVEEYLQTHPEFEQDRDCERFGISFHPGGFLKRMK